MKKELSKKEKEKLGMIPESKQSMEKNPKQDQLDNIRVSAESDGMTTNQGLKIAEDEFSLTAGDRGPTLMEDFHFREKITHFDHERIPERIVHARGTGAHGVFKLNKSMEKYTKAKIFTDLNAETPVFARFSTVQGGAGSADNVRDVRGFALKFYTPEGNYDIVGNNIPVFFIQDAIKFPDLIHAVKPEPHNEMPQGGSAHDTFWDFVANNHETAHTLMWAMSDRAIPRSLRMMDGFAIHTFRWINEKGEAVFVKYHFKPTLGVHSKVWDEAQKTNGKDPDFHRRDLTDAINNGDFPVWEVGVQILPEDQEFSLDFDILDPTKIWPEEDIPVEFFGTLTLNRNVDNFFAETEQAAFHPGSIVPGIDFTNDPLLQGRLFSYTDTQLIRLGGPNFHQIPINAPVVPVVNNQRQGYHQHQIHQGMTSYHKNSLNNNRPSTTLEEAGGFAHYQEKVDGRKIRNRSESFKDFYSQPAMFYKSLTKVEQEHVRDAFIFELSMCNSMDVRQQATDLVAHINKDLAQAIADKIGTTVSSDIKEATYDKISPALSQENTPKKPDTLKVAIVVTEGFDGKAVETLMKELKAGKAMPEILSDQGGMVKGSDGVTLKVDKTHLTEASALVDGAIFMGGEESKDPTFKPTMMEFAKDTYHHFKPMAMTKATKDVFAKDLNMDQAGLIVDDSIDAKEYLENLAQHRFWDRQL